MWTMENLMGWIVIGQSRILHLTCEGVAKTNCGLNLTSKPITVSNKTEPGYFVCLRCTKRS